MCSTNDNLSFRDLTTNPDREFADRAVFATAQGLLDRGISHSHVANALFDMALSVAPGDGSKETDTADWAYLMDAFKSQILVRHEELFAAIRGDTSADP